MAKARKRMQVYKLKIYGSDDVEKLCVECEIPTNFRFRVRRFPLCIDCFVGNKRKYSVLSARKALRKYNISSNEIKKLDSFDERKTDGSKDQVYFYLESDIIDFCVKQKRDPVREHNIMTISFKMKQKLTYDLKAKMEVLIRSITESDEFKDFLKFEGFSFFSKDHKK